MAEQLLVERSDGLPLTRDFGGDSLHHLRGGPRIDERCGFRISAIHRDAFLPIAGDELHRARFEINGADAAIVEIGD